MDFRVLGSIRFEIDGEEVTVRPQAQLLVAFMLVSERQQIDIQGFANLVGEPGEREKARRTIRDVIWKLRKTALGEMLYEPRYGSRGIRADPSGVDYLRFRDLVARAEHEGGAERIATLQHALDEWDDVPLAGLSTPGAEHLRARLLDEHRAVRLELIESLVKEGELAIASKEALNALAVWPSDEMFMRFRVCLLIAVAAKRRAKEEYCAWVKSMEGPTGVFDTFVAEANEVFSTHGFMQAVVRRPVPSQLPNSRSSLIGREGQYAELNRALLLEGAEENRLVAITGMPGVGKTALAINWAHANLSAFDGVLYEDLEGFAEGEPRPAEGVLARFLEELGIPVGTRDRRAAGSMYRSALAERRLLVVIDNARDAEHARPLLPGRGGSAAIVTSRDGLAGLVAKEGARWVTVTPLDIGDGSELLRREIRNPRDRIDPYFKQITEFCGGLPLALHLVAAITNAMPDLTVRDVAKQLGDERNRLDALGYHDPDLNLHAVFKYSYRVLTPGARQLLERVAIHPGPTISMAALTVLNDHEMRATKVAVHELRGASLLEIDSPGRFRLHDLIRDFASALVVERDQAEASQVRRHALDYLLYSAAACDEKLDAGRLLPIDRSAYRHAFAPADVQQAMAWFRSEHSTLMAAIRCAEQESLIRYVWLLPLILVTYQWRAHRYLELKPLLESAVAATHKVAGPADEATVHRMIAGTLRNLDKLPLARHHLGLALELARSAGDVLGVARTHHMLASFHLESRPPNLDVAMRHLEEALAAFEGIGNIVGGAGARAGLCSLRFARGEYEEAEDLCDEAREAYRQQGDLSGEANMLRQRGRIKIARSDLTGAVADFSTAVHVYRDADYDHRAADVLVEKAQALVEMGQVDEAREVLVCAREIYSALGSGTEAKIGRVDVALQRLA